MKTQEELRADGFIIDDTCYPNVAYKGPRFRPDELVACLTEKEGAFLASLKDCVERIKWMGPPPGFTPEEAFGRGLDEAEAAIRLAMGVK